MDRKQMVGLVGVPSNSSGAMDGVARGPAVLRRAGLVDAVQAHVDLRDYGDVILPQPSPERDSRTHLIDPRGFALLVPLVRKAVESVLLAGRFPLIIGGDCPLLLGCLLAARTEGRVGLLFVDGHEDGYLPAQSPTGEAADMELAFALGLADASWSANLAAHLPAVRPADTRMLGPRDAEILREEGVASLRGRVPLVDGDAVLRDPAQAALRACSSLPRPWWFHIDLDVLSTAAMAAVDYPQPGGLDWEALLVLARTAMSHEPVGLDITIYNPDLDPSGVHAHRIVGFLADVFRLAWSTEEGRYGGSG